MTIPAGVRSDSNGVVSGVGGAGAGVDFSAAWWPSDAGELQDTAAPVAAKATARKPIVLLNESSEWRRILTANRQILSVRGRWRCRPLAPGRRRKPATLLDPDVSEAVRGWYGL
jgi:hypothetical protein